MECSRFTVPWLRGSGPVVRLGRSVTGAPLQEGEAWELTGEEKVLRRTVQSPEPCGPASLSWTLPGQRSSNLFLKCLKDCARNFLG